MPKLSNAAPTFPVADVDDTIRWYQEQLGFTAYPFPETPPYVFAIVSRDTVEIMFQRVGLREGLRQGGVWDAYIRMERCERILRINQRQSGNRVGAAQAALRRLGVRSEGS
jgi:hypothetical protein